MQKKQKLKIISLGGLDEIGKNLTVFEYNNDIIIVDCGLAFPDDEMLGIDLVIPDMSYLIKNADKVKGIFLTHGHEDHIGGLPFLLKELRVPVFGSRLTLGLVSNRLKEHGLLSISTLRNVSAGDTITVGCFKVEYINANHSIPDAAILAIETPVGIIVHTGDFKIDPTPIEGQMIDLARIGEIGKKGVLALLCESTNVEREGYTMSEQTVGDSFESIFQNNKKSRILIATFASNVHRMQQVINAAERHKRKVAVSGRSIVNVLQTAIDLGYIKIPKGLLIDIDELPRYNPEHSVIITTGSQGEPMSALVRMALGDHKKISIKAGDLVIISANPIPGNERTVSRVINELFKRGANVIYDALADIHVSGHACQEEIKLMHSLVKPKFFIPIHGEYRHLVHHVSLAEAMGTPRKNIFLMQIGQVLCLDANSAKVEGTVPAGRILVDGLGVGDVGNIVLRDRKHLAQDGLIIIVAALSSDSGQIVSGPDVISRGFVYVRESEDLIDKVKAVAKKSIEGSKAKNLNDWNTIKSVIKNEVGDFLYERTKRKPMILPVILEI